ncbi:molybdenum cofactor biosynthesis protein MoaF [Actinobacteria bacterium YIM 96077]|uniref:Molybdenum cofactor biosynthesis protein MoaF n=1 Tax=Phytoactinopolyspora halophila TaxID=1981511 RepID=A0A329QL25_9ACTN|nr:MoaF C-terminal domain-containing protein [Phytoactinopolyspora halophila]AYY15325.1 molybdenum cofactor biosynthesis protein MoaF [Actinobacteria bacterium YIM 96077]RAW12591.1 molybdenum cofactor biosynthesis protein MoaF [Phytoactinopolyspora halophila]
MTSTSTNGDGSTARQVDLSDRSTWLPLDGLAPGFDAHKAPPVDDLAGCTVVTENPGGTAITYHFTGRHVRCEPGATGDVDDDDDGRGAAGQHGDDEYEAFVVDDDLYYVQYHMAGQPESAVSLVLDLRYGRALRVVSTIGTAAEVPRVTQTFTPATIQGRQAAGAIAPSTTLVGRRTMWVYSDEHAYEHVYLSPHWYTWQCLAGPEKGLADTDENTVYEIRPGICLFAWREKVVPCAAVTVADHRDARDLRSHGVLFGLDETGKHPTYFTFGAFGRLLSVTAHPDRYDPALA